MPAPSFSTQHLSLGIRVPGSLQWVGFCGAGRVSEGRVECWGGINLWLPWWRFWFFQSTGGKAFVWGLWAEQGSLLVRSQSFTSPCPPLSSESWLPCQVPVLGEDMDNCLDLHNEANSLVFHSSQWFFLHSWLNLLVPFREVLRLTHS